jgi:hypothetical protein
VRKALGDAYYLPWRTCREQASEVEVVDLGISGSWSRAKLNPEQSNLKIRLRVRVDGWQSWGRLTHDLDQYAIGYLKK